MHGKFDKLQLLPPRVGTPWTGSPPDSLKRVIRRLDGQKVSLETPLFLYALPWHELPIQNADALAVALGQRGICVSALRSELAPPDDQPDFHQFDQVERKVALPRMVPYRPERYGFHELDFDDARVIDIRLTAHRDPTGRFAYSPEQLERWEATPEDNPLSGGAWVPAATFPPDVPSLEHLGSKFNQIRSLSEAAAFVSIGPYRLADEMAAILVLKPDGVIIDCSQCWIEPLDLALIVKRAREVAVRAGMDQLPIWIAPGAVTPDDVVKLIALGADAVAIDSWCDEIVDAIREDRSSRGVSNQQLLDWVDGEFFEPLERVSGLLNSIQYVAPEDRLGCFDADWARQLHITPLSPLRTESPSQAQDPHAS